MHAMDGMDGMGGMGGMDGMGGMGGMMLWMVIIWVLVALALVALVVLGAVWLVRRNNGTDQVRSPDSPEEILRRRYAAGELDEDEYLRRQAGLQD